MLKDEIKKKKPFESPAEEAYLNLLRTTTVLAADFERLFKDAGLSEPQYNVLRILRGAGADGAGLPCLEIASRMITRVPDITRLVDRLEAAGLVERARTSEDRRVVLVKITRKGLEAIAPLGQPLVEIHRRQMGHMSPKELDELSRLLVKAREPADRAGPVACDGNHHPRAANGKSGGKR
jgi:DNA-binding MarR family transcriptional regulator